MDPVGYELCTPEGGKGGGVRATRGFQVGETVMIGELKSGVERNDSLASWINIPPMHRLFLIIGACLALVLAGCGDDSSTTAGGSDYTVPQGTKERRAAEKKVAEEEAAEEAAAAKQAVADAPEVSVPNDPPPKSLVIEDLKTGSGATAKPGHQVTVHYVGVLYDGGKMFDVNWGNEPFSFELGAQQVIPGWDQGVKGMKVGGERKLLIPPDLAYGSQGSYPSIPPNATLVFQIELLDVK